MVPMEYTGKSNRAYDEATGYRRPFPPSRQQAVRGQAQVRRLARGLGHALAEAIWTTRCIVCDAPGEPLCRSCRLALPYIDRWLACPHCGSPHGTLQCVDCNTFALAEVGRTALPFERCISAIEHRGAARGIVTGFKDAGERRLAADIAAIMADAIPRSWLAGDAGLAFVPADARARRRRGFDHMELVATELARITALPRLTLLEKLPAADQRGLTRRRRFANMAGAMRLAARAPCAPRRVLLIDDVYTTGATIFAASDALKTAGVQQVLCATFARVL